MKNKIKKTIKELIPPLFLKSYQWYNKKYGFFGDYSSWQDAKNASTGYNTDAIVEKVKQSALLVKSGKAAYERDGVIFKNIEYNWPLLANLLWVASKHNNELNLVDFGGALGTSYNQNINFLKHLNKLNWNIIDQEKFVDCGKEMFAGNNLNFYYSIEECLKNQKANTIILSSVIEYLEQPYEFLKQIKNNFEHIIIDRTPFFEDNDRIVVQKIPPRIYDASYPCWIFNYKKLLNFFNKDYEVMADFQSDIGENIEIGNTKASYKGLFLIKKSSLNKDRVKK